VYEKKIIGEKMKMVVRQLNTEMKVNLNSIFILAEK